MKRDEVRAKFPDITDDQLDWLMDQNGASVNAERAKTKSANDALKEAQDRIAEYEKAKQQSMTDEERVKAALEQAAKAQSDFAVKSNRLDATARFVEAGVPKEQYEPLLDKVVTADAEATASVVDSMVSMLAANAAKVEASTKEAILSGYPKPNGGAGTGNSGGITKEQFDNMSFAEMVQLHDESPELYNQFIEGE